MRITVEYTHEDEEFLPYPHRKFTAEIPNDADIETIMDSFHGMLVGMTWNSDMVLSRIRNWADERIPDITGIYSPTDPSDPSDKTPPDEL